LNQRDKDYGIGRMFKQICFARTVLADAPARALIGRRSEGPWLRDPQRLAFELP
jgi:hypothetical protein